MWAKSHIHLSHCFLADTLSSLPANSYSFIHRLSTTPVPTSPTQESQQQLTGEVAHFEDKFRNEVQSLGQHRREK